MSTRPVFRDAAIEDELGAIASKTLRDASDLADKLEADVFQGSLKNELRPFIFGYESLPGILRSFARNIGNLLDATGKPGRKNEAFTNQLLVIASEFVRLATGSFNDEHLAELFPAVLATDLADDFSGDSIRKRRDRLKRQYPLLYAQALQKASHHFQTGSSEREPQAHDPAGRVDVGYE